MSRIHPASYSVYRHTTYRVFICPSAFMRIRTVLLYRTVMHRMCQLNTLTLRSLIQYVCCNLIFMRSTDLLTSSSFVDMIIMELLKFRVSLHILNLAINHFGIAATNSLGDTLHMFEMIPKLSVRAISFPLMLRLSKALLVYFVRSILAFLALCFLVDLFILVLKLLT